MFNKLMIILISFVVIILFLHLYIYQQVQKKPYNNPSRFIDNKEFASKNNVIVCVGDSITHGRMSCNYVDLLARRLNNSGFQLVNAGVNGELAHDVLQRLAEVIKCDPDFVTILIGTNDMYASLSRMDFRKEMKQMELVKMHGRDRFRVNLIKICSQLKANTKAKIALLSLPPIGEELDHVAYGQATIYSKVIKEIASREGVNYLPLHEVMTNFLKSRDSRPKLSLNNNLLFAQYKGILLHYIFGKSFDDISTSNGFLLLTDFLHLNCRGAEMIADLIQDFVT